MKRVAILLSGRGSNFVALADAIDRGDIDAELGLVLSNQPEASGLVTAKERSYPNALIPSADKPREAFDAEVVAELQRHQIEIVCLAGFMRLLSPVFVRAFPQRILNIHPSLLPAFTGLHAQRQALDWGVRISGCTVHFVDEELDHGPILLQAAVPVKDDDDEEALSGRILAREHEIYPEALRLVCSDRVQVVGRRVRITD